MKKKIKYNLNEIFWFYSNFYFLNYSFFNSENSFILVITKILFVINISIIIYIIYTEIYTIENIFPFRFLFYLATIGVFHFILNALKLKYIFSINSVALIKKIISFLFLFIILYLLLVIAFIIIVFSRDIDNMGYNTRMVFLIIVLFIHCVYEFLVSLKINISEKNKFDTMLDIVFLLINFNYINNIIFLLKATLLDKKENLNPTIVTRYYITKFKNIYIEPYLLPIEFINIHNKMHYLNSISPYFKIERKELYFKIESNINNIRKENFIEEISVDYSFPDFIINGPTDVFLSDKEVFKIDDKKYILKYKNVFTNTEKNIEIFLKKNLNRITLFTQGDILYIFLFQSDKILYYRRQKEDKELDENFSFIGDSEFRYFDDNEPNDWTI